MIGPIACLGLACASTGGGAPATTPQPAAEIPTAAPASLSGDQTGTVVPVVARETTPDRTRRESVPAHVREVRDQMEEAYQAGLEAYQAGRFDEAKGQFDRAVDIVLTSDIDLNEQRRSRRRSTRSCGTSPTWTPICTTATASRRGRRTARLSTS